MADAPNTWNAVTIDCRDPRLLARFWGTLLGREPGPSKPGWVYLGDRGDALPRLIFQPVPEPKRGKARIHLDVTVADIEAGIAQVIALGGASTGDRYEFGEGILAVMTDPEGNEFCLAQYFD